MRDGSIQSWVKVYDHNKEAFRFKEGERRVVGQDTLVDDGTLELQEGQTRNLYEGLCTDLFGEVNKKNIITKSDLDRSLVVAKSRDIPALQDDADSSESDDVDMQLSSAQRQLRHIMASKAKPKKKNVQGPQVPRSSSQSSMETWVPAPGTPAPAASPVAGSALDKAVQAAQKSAASDLDDFGAARSIDDCNEVSLTS